MSAPSSIGNLKWIPGDVVRSCLNWDSLIPAMMATLSSVSTDDVVQPIRARLYDRNTEGTLLAMPGLVRSRGALATKIVTMYPRASPSHTALVLLSDQRDGTPLALLDGESITELRTAAASAAATRAILTTKKLQTVDVVAVLGAGVQGAAHARALYHTLKPKQIRLWSRTSGNAANLSSLLLAEGIPCSSHDCIQDTVRDADVINTCTLSATPILMADWVTRGAHINSVGAARADWQEIDPKLMREAVIYADSSEAAAAEAGDLILSGSSLAGEIGDVIRGTLTPIANQTTIFKNLGMAAEDAVAARLVYDICNKQL